MALSADEIAAIKVGVKMWVKRQAPETLKDQLAALRENRVRLEPGDEERCRVVYAEMCRLLAEQIARYPASSSGRTLQ
jgi:hypothetical protein